MTAITETLGFESSIVFYLNIDLFSIFSIKCCPLFKFNDLIIYVEMYNFVKQKCQVNDFIKSS